MARDATFIPLEAKLRIPTLSDVLVQRGDVIDVLLESPPAPVVLVAAPPGYGKSTVVEQWAASDVRPFAWVNLDEGDNDPASLATYVTLALQRVERTDAAFLTLVDDVTGLVDEVLAPELGRILLRRKQPFVLVLDNAGVLTEPAAVGLLQVIVDHLPAGSQLALVATTPPAMDWSDLRAKRQLVEVGANELRLRHAEAAALLREIGLTLREDEVQELLDRTEGWPTGLYLAGLSLAAGPTQRRSVSSVVGSDSVMATYFHDHLLGTLSEDDRTFLLRASVLPWLSGPLCDAVLQATGSDATLRRLAASNTLLVRTNREGSRFRLHRLFAEALRAELGRREPQVRTDLYARASGWLERNRHPEEAIACAIAADDVVQSARLIWDQACEYLNTGQVLRLERWLEAFTPRELAQHAKLALTAAWCALHRGRPAEHWVAAAENGRYDATRPGEAESVAAATALLHAVLARNGVAQMQSDAQLAIRLYQPDDPWRCTAELLDGVATHLKGSPLEAQRKLRGVESQSGAFMAHEPHALALAQLAFIAVDRDDWRVAERLIDRANELIDRHELEGDVRLVPACCVSALLAARSGQIPDASRLTRRCLSRIAVAASPAWLIVQCRLLLAQTQLLLGDAAAARIQLSEGHSLLKDVPDAVLLRKRVESAWRQIEQLPLGFEHGVSTLTSAELRVLQYLPTHLSFAQIGEQLYVSRNTVKTQAIAAYRKLGVSSRSEAVSRAYALGLLMNQDARVGGSPLETDG